ncbi:MAG: hypothetical protein DBP02_15205 [gamma proteobacterium symbiont of Ctena orbiculata]|nr:MAG: hypothetical protein DBP02_15205 [gamma proteobacterium symbiont of Ctena orbiculata]
MNPIRIFAMNTASQINPLSVGRSTATDKMSPALAAGMSAGMPKVWYQAVMLKWALDWSGANDLELRLLMEAAGLAAEHGWEPPKGEEFLRRMAGLAVAEMALPAQFRQVKDKCEFLGISPSTFCNRWKGRYEQVYQVLESWSAEGYHYLMRKNIDRGEMHS